MNRISQIYTTDTHLHITWQDQQSSFYPFFWLRDHANDPQSYNQRTAQRQLNTALVKADVKPQQLIIAEDKASIQIRWPDTSESAVYTTAFLQAFAYPEMDTPSSPLLSNSHAWCAASLSPKQVVIEFNHLTTNEALLHLLETNDQFGFVLILGCPPNSESVQMLADKIGYIRETLFGGLWEFEANGQMADSAYSFETLRPHTDGIYSNDAPGLQILLNVLQDAEGGESIIVDGLEIAQRLRQQTPKIYDTLCQVEVPGCYRGDNAVLRASRPVFRTNRQGQLQQISFNNYDRVPFRLPDEQMQQFYEALRRFESLANDPTLQWRHQLQLGEMLIFNNWRVLHGRTAFNGRRRMMGCYLNHEDFESRLELLRSNKR